MIYFELDENGYLVPVDLLKKDFISKVDIGPINTNDLGLIKYSQDKYSSIPRKVRLSNEDILNQNRALVKLYLHNKKLEGCSSDTISTYRNFLSSFIYQCVMPIDEFTTDIIKRYLMLYEETNQVSHNTLDQMRISLNGFFKWLEDEEYIFRNPVRKIHKIKGENKIPNPFSEEELELIKDACISMRELAIVDLLSSSGIRATELCKLNKSDINLESRTGIVSGKGSKERKIYISYACKVHMIKYLSHRHDNNPALFVSSQKPYSRLTKRGLEFIINTIGRRAGVYNCYPHRFRTTLATRLIGRGVPIEQVQQILGHNKIETTLIYARVSDIDIKINHTKYA